MNSSYDLSQLDPNSFEHMVNALAMRVLGAGLTGFGPGSDGGRDGYFEGEAPYPNETERWTGRWYIQSKYHRPHLSADPQKWLLDKIKEELALFADPDSGRKWPDIWIVATNIDPSAVPDVGAFDKARALVKQVRPELVGKFDIWGGQKLIAWLGQYKDIAERYGHFLTPGHVLTELLQNLVDVRASVEQIIRNLVLSGIEEQKHTKLEQAGSMADSRPGIHRLFVDLPVLCREYGLMGTALESLTKTAAQNHRGEPSEPSSDDWLKWKRHPNRAPVWFIKGGPGHGKSTIGQYFCQIQRAALILGNPALAAPVELRQLSEAIKIEATKNGFWPASPRIPIYIELKQYAQWFGERSAEQSRGILTYLAARSSREIEQEVLVGTLRRALACRSWFIVFDGLDEVPGDIKDDIAKEVKNFLRQSASTSDVLTLCTSRPQGYSGQFNGLLNASVIELLPLSTKYALACAESLIRLDRTPADAAASLEVLRNAIAATAVRELMTTPLQSHIMAIIVRDGKRPPERKWELYKQFYEVIRAREANRNLPDRELSKILQQDTALLRTVHNRLGFSLHAQAETATGARASLSRDSFRQLVVETVRSKKDGDIGLVVETVMRAATERLVLISTPDDGQQVRFDIRQLQEFFAAEFIYDGVHPETLRARLEVIANDAHWREVMHFLMSALVEQNRKTELSVAIEVLKRIDEGNDDDYSLNRRLATGSLIAARLLEDGVLEQDKSIRTLFRERMVPIMASSEIACVEPVLRVAGPASKAWIIELMLRRVVEAKENESLGARMGLWLSLPDGHIRVPEFCEHLRKSSPTHIGRVLSATLSENSDAPMKNWQLAFIVEFFARSDCFPSNLETFGRLRHRLLSRPVYPLFRPKLAELNGEEATELMKLFQLEPEPSRGNAIDYGLISVQEFEPGILLRANANLLAERVDIVRLGGFFRLLGCALSFVCAFNRERYISLLECLRESWGDIHKLPQCIWPFLPLPVDSNVSPRTLIEVLRGISDLDFFRALANGKIGDFEISTRNRFRFYGKPGSESVTVAQFLSLLEEYPSLALYLWSSRESYPASIQNVLNSEEVAAGILNMIKEGSESLTSELVRWGGEFLRISGSEQSHVRVQLCGRVAEQKKVEVWGYYSDRVQFSSFELCLPQERAVLPALASHIVSVFGVENEDIGDEEIAGGEGNEVKERGDVLIKSKEAARVVGRYIPLVRDLELVADTGEIGIEERGAAVLLGMLHADGGLGFALKRQDLLVKLCAAGSVVGAGVAVCVDVLGVERVVEARTMLGRLIDASKGGEEGRGRWWDYVLARWRERAYAPVFQRDLQRIWLRDDEEG
jgi:hypothetical protein